MATQTLQQLGEDQVLSGIYAASRNLGAPFCASGTLGRLPVRLAVAWEDGKAAEEQAQVVELPGGGDGHLAALLRQCIPAKFGKGSETGMVEFGGLLCVCTWPDAHSVFCPLPTQCWTSRIALRWRCPPPAFSPRTLRLPT